METALGAVERVGFFRPLVASGAEPDTQIELIRQPLRARAVLEDMYALSDDEAQARSPAGRATRSSSAW